MARKVLTLVFLTVLWCTTLAAVERRSQVCYPPLGCFHSDGDQVRAPLSPTKVATHFKLYDRQHRTTPYRDLEGPSWTALLPEFAKHFNGSRETKVLIHRFLDRSNAEWILQMRDALLNKGDFNILVVDWSRGSKWPYEQAAGNTFLVGAELSLLLEYLFGHAHLQAPQVHIIAHSLGAQMAGHSGLLLNGKLGRISALDPADPGFTGKPLDRRLDSSDAVFVDVIHTDGSHFNYISGYGTIETVGDVDFYPNGGEHQPGCDEQPANSALSGILHGRFGSVVGALTCSHSRAHVYFMESLTSSCKYRSHPCTSLAEFDAGRCMGCPPGGCPVMGYDANQYQAGGAYFLATSASPGFCGKEYYVEVHISQPMKTTYGDLFLTLVGSKATSEELKFTKLMRQYHASDVERHIVATHTDVGIVQGVKVKFVRATGIHALGAAHDILIQSVIVTPVESPTQQMKFCAQDARIHEQSTVTLHLQSSC